MIEFGNDPAKIERYRAFWNCVSVSRPLVGFSYKSWFPMEEYSASAAWQTATFLSPEMVDPDAFLDDQERLLREGETLDDDIIRGASPSQAVPWLCGMLGGALRILPGSILAEERKLSWREAGSVRLDRENAWFRKYVEFAEVLAQRAQDRFPVSHGTLVGPTDLAAMLRGHGQSVLDLLEQPGEAANLLRRTADIFREVTEAVWQRIPQYHGGYFDAQYSLWAPGSIVRMQEDASALYSPGLYRKFVLPVDRELAGAFDCSFIHLHSTSLFLMDMLLEIDEIRCYEINNDVSGPPVEELIPYFQRIQRAGRPLLIRGSFKADELKGLLDVLEPGGLYLYIMVEQEEEADRLRPLVGL